MKLAEFQDALADVLLPDGASEAAPRAAPLVMQPAFAVYRNTVMRGCIDALQANYPAVLALVGEAWFRAAAATYVSQCPPRDPCLVYYGDGFATFLETFPPAGDLPYLPDVARLDRCWCEALVARDEPLLNGAQLASLSPEALARTVLRPHATARWRWFDDAPIVTLWSRNRDLGAAADCSDVDWRGEGVLITRPGEAVRHAAIDRAACVFLDACRDGCTLADAVSRTLAAGPDADFHAIAASSLSAGAFTASSFFAGAITAFEPNVRGSAVRSPRPSGERAR